MKFTTKTIATLILYFFQASEQRSKHQKLTFFDLNFELNSHPINLLFSPWETRVGRYHQTHTHGQYTKLDILWLIGARSHFRSKSVRSFKRRRCNFPWSLQRLEIHLWRPNVIIRQDLTWYVFAEPDDPPPNPCPGDTHVQVATGNDGLETTESSLNSSPWEMYFSSQCVCACVRACVCVCVWEK